MAIFLRISYILLAIVHVSLWLYAPESSFLINATKVLFMPLLMADVIMVETPKSMANKKYLLLTALFFSWLGDILLLNIYGDKNLFVFGLSAFLLAHVFYIILFMKEQGAVVITKSNLKLFIAALIIVWLISIVRYLLPYLQGMKIPVLVYVLVISLMALAALNRTKSVSTLGGVLVFLGAILFMLSDMFIAIDKFSNPFDQSRALVMSTYLAAQLMIVGGIKYDIQNKKE